MDRLADLRDEGKSIDRGVATTGRRQTNFAVHHWFFSTDLTFYVRGGRISKAAGWFGTALNICPLLNMDNLGRLIPRFKIRGKKRVIAEIEKKMEAFAEDRLDYSGKCFIPNSACEEDAVRWPGSSSRALRN